MLTGKSKVYVLRRTGTDGATIEVSLPPEWVRGAGLKAGDRVECRPLDGSRLLVLPAK